MMRDLYRQIQQLQDENAALRAVDATWEAMVKADLSTIEALTKRVAELEALSREALSALVWCGGSDDFAPEGKARPGWDKVVSPVFVNGRNTLPHWGTP